MVEVTFYESDDEMWQDLRNKMSEADSRVQPWQLKHKAGDILVSDPGYGFPIFHEVLDNEKIVGESLKKYGDEYEDEGFYILDTYCFGEKPWHYRFCNNFSEVCEYGELGDFHISGSLGKLRYREDFEKLRENGFALGEERIEVIRE